MSVKLLITAIVSLTKLAGNIKSYAISKQVKKLNECAERTDEAEYQCGSRIVQAQRISKFLEERACDKYQADIDKVEADRKSAGNTLDELKAL